MGSPLIAWMISDHKILEIRIENLFQLKDLVIN